MKTKKIIQIETVSQIIQRLNSDGDLREHCHNYSEQFEAHGDDDLGFYQQACDFMVIKLEASEYLELRVAELIVERDQALKMRGIAVEKHEAMRERFDEMKARIKRAIECLPQLGDPFMVDNLKAILSDAEE